MQTRWTNIEPDLRIHAREWSAGTDAPHVVLVHGVVVSSRYLVPLGEALSKEFNVHAPDLPGHGKSDKPKSTYDTKALADALLKWMDASGIESAVLYGHSYGSQIAAEAAAAKPEKVKGLVIAGPTTDARARSPWRQALRWLQVLPHESLQEVSPVVRDAIDSGPSRAAAQVRRQCAHRIEEPLVATTSPIVILRGEHDRVAPEGWCRRLSTLAGAKEVRTIPGAGHNVHATRTDEVAQAIREMALD